MPITPQQREDRRKSIGSSDSAAIAGVMPIRPSGAAWKTAADVYMEKVYGTDDETSEAAELGNWLEPLLVAWAGDELGFEVERDISVMGPCGLLAANLDGRLKGRREGIEAKSSGIIWAGAVSDEWGESETDQVPNHVAVQCQHQMYAAELDIVHVPTLLGGRGRVMFHVPRNEKMIADIVDIDQAFWNDHVLTRIPPAAQPSLSVAKRVRRVPNTTKEIPPELYARVLDSRDARLNAEDVEKQVKADFLLALGDAEAATCGAMKMLTYYEVAQNRKAQPARTIKFRKFGGVPRRESLDE